MEVQPLNGEKCEQNTAKWLTFDSATYSRPRRCAGLASMATTHCPIRTGLWCSGAQLNVRQFTLPPYNNRYEAMARPGAPQRRWKKVV